MQKYGQHFLKNEGVAEKIIVSAAAALAQTPSAELIEIGPGKGFITSRLLALRPQFTVVEIDPEMVACLNANFKGLEIINKDFLEFDLSSLPPRPVVFVSNLPYIDAAEILLKVLEYPHTAAAVFMFQKEQAERIYAAVGTPQYGPLSLAAQYLAEIKKVCRVSKGSFNPPPKVESEVLLLTKKAPADETYFKFKNLTRRAFAYKRKTLQNALALGGLEIKTNLPPAVRPSQITLEEYKKLAKENYGQNR